MRVIYNSEIFNTFEIENFQIDKPLLIKHDNLFVSNHIKHNIVLLFNNSNINSIVQEWVIEKDDLERDIYYIKTTQERETHVRYLGAPNKNNIVYLYTSKNRFTKWRITKIEGTTYSITYAGEKFNNKKHTIVVAAYNESVDWLLPYEDCVIIYHKGQNAIPPFSNIIKLDNIGREGHTYLKYIITNFNNLPDRVTFLQAEPFLHNDTILYGIDNYEKSLPFQPLGLRYLKDSQIPTDEIVNKFKTTTNYGLEYLVLKLNKNLNYSVDYFFKDDGITMMIDNYQREFRLQENQFISDNFLNRCKFPKTYMNKSTDKIDFTFSALFSVIRTNIKIYSESEYKSILEELLVHHDQGGVNGYVLERMWMYILDNI